MENKDLHKKLTALMNGLTDEQKEKAKACKTLNELMAFAGKEGIELPDEQLERSCETISNMQKGKVKRYERREEKHVCGADRRADGAGNGRHQWLGLRRHSGQEMPELRMHGQTCHGLRRMDLPSVRDLPEKERSNLLNGPAKLFQICRKAR